MEVERSQEKLSLTFNFNIKLTITFLLFFPLLVYLGFWQLSRADEKQKILDDELTVSQLPATPWRMSGLADRRLVQERGRFISEKYWLLDNSVRNGQAGFEVIMPFATDSGTFLVNRGWVKGDPARRELPSFETDIKPVEIIGRIYQPTKIDVLATTTAWPSVIAAYAPQEMLQKITNEQAPLYVLRLQQDSPQALVTGWLLVNSLPEKHTAYAVQWFAMALALLLMFLVYSCNIVAVLAWNRTKLH